RMRSRNPSADWSRTNATTRGIHCRRCASPVGDSQSTALSDHPAGDGALHNDWAIFAKAPADSGLGYLTPFRSRGVISSALTCAALRPATTNSKPVLALLAVSAEDTCKLTSDR